MGILFHPDPTRNRTILKAKLGKIENEAPRARARGASFFWEDKETKMKVKYKPVHLKEWFDTVDRICDIKQLKEIFDRHHNDIVMAGAAPDGNQKDFFSLFDKIILLQCNPKTLIRRMKTRVNKSGYGKTKAEQDVNIEWQKEYDPLLISLGAISVHTEGGLGGVVDKVIEKIKSS